MKKPSLGAIFLTVFLDLLGFGLVIPFLSQNARANFHTTALVGTLVGSVYSLMQFLFVPVWGSLSDRIGRRPVLLWSVFASALSMGALGLALAYSHSIAWVFAARALSGIATANLGTASAYIADVTKPEERAKGMGIFGMAFGLGFVLGPGIGGQLAEILVNGRTGAIACFLAAGLSLVNVVWVFFGLPESLPSKRADLPEEERRARPSMAPRKPIPLNPETLRRSFSHPQVARTVLVNFIIIMSFTNLEQTFPLFTHDEFGLGQRSTGLILMLIGITAALVQGGLMRKLTKVHPEPPLLKTGMMIMALSFFGFAAAPSLGLWSLYAFGMIIAIGNGMTQPTVSAHVSKCAPATEQGAVLGTFQSFASLARVVGPFFAGLFYEFGHRAPFLFAAFGTLVALSIALPLRPAAPHVVEAK